MSITVDFSVDLGSANWIIMEQGVTSLSARQTCFPEKQIFIFKTNIIYVIVQKKNCFFCKISEAIFPDTSYVQLLIDPGLSISNSKHSQGKARTSNTLTIQTEHSSIQKIGKDSLHVKRKIITEYQKVKSNGIGNIWKISSFSIC